MVEWLIDPAKRTKRVAQLAELKERVGHGGASVRAADYMLRDAESRRKPVLRTHYSFATKPAVALCERGLKADFGLRTAECGLNNGAFRRDVRAASFHSVAIR